MDMRRCSSLWACLAVAGTLGCVAPEADYWRDHRLHRRPLPHVTLQALWDHPSTICPESLSDAGEHGVLLHHADGFLWMDPQGVSTEAPRPDPPPGKDAQDEIIRRVLQRHFGEPVQPTGASIWRDLAMVAVPQRSTVHAIHLRKQRIVWTVRTGSRPVTAPQIYRSRVVVQALDNYIYCLTADNGHEIWRTQASHRLTRPAGFWKDRVLVIPETSAKLQVFDLFDGSKAGTWSLPHPDDLFTGAPLVMGDTVVAPHAPVGSQNCSLVAVSLEEQPRSPATAAARAPRRYP